MSLSEISLISLYKVLTYHNDPQRCLCVCFSVRKSVLCDWISEKILTITELLDKAGRPIGLVLYFFSKPHIHVTPRNCLNETINIFQQNN